MKTFPDPKSLRNAADAVDRHNEELKKLAEARDAARAAKTEEGLQEIRADSTARQADLHLASAQSTGDDHPAPAFSMDERSRASVAAPVVKDSPHHSVSLMVVAIIALVAIVAIVVAAFLFFNKAGRGGEATVATASAIQNLGANLGSKLDKSNATSERIEKAIGGLDTKLATAAENASKCNACCTACQPSKPAAKKPKPKAKPAPEKKAEAKPCEECIPTPKAQVHRTEPSKVCAIAIQKSATDKTLLGKMILGEDQNHAGKIGIIFNSFVNDVPNKVAGTPYSLGQDSNGKFDCGVAKKTIEGNWPTVVAYFKVPHDCLPIKS